MYTTNTIKTAKYESLTFRIIIVSRLLCDIHHVKRDI